MPSDSEFPEETIPADEEAQASRESEGPSDTGVPWEVWPVGVAQEVWPVACGCGAWEVWPVGVAWEVGAA